MNLKHIVLCSGVALTSFATHAQVKKSATPASKVATKPAVAKVATDNKDLKLTSLADSASYSLGVLVAQNFKMQNIPINSELMAKALVR
ncbi:hypothetical protein [Flectobacillus sp. BAB-3569]|uniref:hypothetical protein n=1 Tax=Flectobacillus sp. BAB-3569 TaxID=1509483 RepID=UPI000BA3FAA8|nr:hypothetical protein [Flectobacillus sp. BAB-3569]PAC28980.1 hypothetical protein BWI92_17190 [Flectobacillus sp. BAB-3569]